MNNKQKVYDFWNEQPCGTSVTTKRPYSKEYFEEIENYRYEKESDIFEFAQFTRFHGKKILEVGVGAGTDFLQWVRAGAEAYGLDLTEQAIRNVKERLTVYGLQCSELKVADAENLPYTDNYFDLVYSWGVIHHTPNTIKALHEIIRVTKVGGQCKIMVYNKHSPQSIIMYLKYGIMRGRPFRRLSDIYYHHQESIGTKVYTKHDILKLLAGLPVTDIKIYAHVKPRDVYPAKSAEQSLIMNFIYCMLRGMTCLMGYFNAGFYLKFEFTKKQ